MTAAATRTLRVGTRASALARAQTDHVVARARACRSRSCRSSPQGDRSPEPLAQIGGTGVFVSALRHALLGRRDRRGGALLQGPADRAGRGHRAGRRAGRARTRATRSSPATGCALGELPPGPRVGTGSPRRAAQLRALGLGLRHRAELRGNVDTRLGKVGRRRRWTRSCWPMPGCAGWAAPTRSPRSSTRSSCCRRPAQGALAVECRPPTTLARELARRARRRRDPRRRHRRTRAARRARGRLLRAGRRAGRGRRRRRRRRSLPPRIGDRARRQRRRPAVGHRTAHRCRRRRPAAWPPTCSPTALTR